MTSTVSCDLPGAAWIYGLAWQNVGVGGPDPGTRVHGLQVTGTYSLDAICPEAGAVLDVSGIIPADLARGFRPGEATVYLEFAYDAVNPDATHTYGFMFGYLFLNGTDYPELRPTG